MVAHGPLYRWVLFGLPCVSITWYFFPKELVVKIRVILSLSHTDTHTKSVVLASLDKSGDLAPLACPVA